MEILRRRPLGIVVAIQGSRSFSASLKPDKERSYGIMKSEVVAFSEDRVMLRASVPKNIGEKVDLEVRLPKGILIKSFILNGTVTQCAHERCPEKGGYLLEMEIGDLSPLNEKILEAYKDFLSRDQALRKIKLDLKAFQEAFDNFGEKLRLLRRTAEEVRNNVRGTLELMKRNSDNKNTTIH
jgi:hypothetical protein